MWSRNGRPVATWIRPRPLRAIVAASFVSLLLRVTWPFLLLKTNLHRVSVTAQAFERGQAQRGVAERLHVLAAEGEDAGPLDEGVHAERRRVPRRAGGRERVVRPRRVVAQGHGGVGPDEDRSRVAHPRRQRLG